MSNPEPTLRPVGGQIPKPSNAWVEDYKLKEGWQMPSYETRSIRKTQIGHEIEKYQSEIRQIERLASPSKEDTERLSYIKDLIEKLQVQKDSLL